MIEATLRKTIEQFPDIVEFIENLELSEERRSRMKRTQKWITENFEKLVEDYGGKYIAVGGERVVASALTPKEAMKAARKVAKEEEISLLKVPREEELVCIL